MTDNQKLLRTGFIGAGEMATWAILPALHFAPIRLQAICDLDRERAESAAEKFGARGCYTDYREMFANEDLEALIIQMHPGARQAIVLDALSSGYDGVMMMGCKSGDDYQCHFVRGSAMAQERMMKVGEPLQSMMLEKERVETFEIAIADAHKLPDIIGKFMEMIDTVGPNPFKGM